MSEMFEEIETSEAVAGFAGVVRCLDGSYVIDRNGHPYHVPDEGEFAELWAEVDAWAREHPAEVTEEAPPPPPVPPTPEEIAAQYEKAVDDRLEAFARELYSKGYANAVTYVNSANAQWRLEAEYLIALRDETWQAAYVYMNEVMPLVAAGELPVPALEEVFAALPTPAWPVGSRGYVAG